MEKLINYKRLDDLVKRFEAFIKEQEIDLDEQKLLFDILRDRREQALNQMRARDMTMNMPLGGLFKKLTKSMQKPDEDEVL